jgi:spore maturation protein CgeB
MRILFVDLEFDYGIPKRGKNDIGQRGFLESLKSLGHEVIPFYYDRFLKNTNDLQGELLRKAADVKPDLVFFILFQNQFSVETLNELKKNYTTFNWFGDDSWRFDSFTKLYANCFDFCSTSDKYAFPKYKGIGQENVLWGQWAVINTEPPQDIENIDYEFDVSFIGGFNYHRKWFLNTLRKRGIRVAAFGNGWDNGPVSLERMNEIFLKSKINLNLSNSKSFDLRYCLSSPINLLHTIKGKKSGTQMKARHFEINYNGGFQLSSFASSLDEFLVIGQEVVCYTDVDEATDLIQYYLNANEERERIKIAGYKRCVENHTYKHRLATILKAIEEKSNEK